MTGLVVVASVAIKWFVRGDDSEAAHRILVSPPRLHTPDLLRLELANGSWKNWRRNIVTPGQAALASLCRKL